MKSVIIGTTAINRPELHNDIFYEWIDWILKLDTNKYDIKWFINIDIIDALPHDYNETKLNLEQIINKRINVTFLNNGEKGNFLKACQRVATNIEQYVINKSLDENNVIIIWLEDDWKLNTIVALPITEIIDTYHSNLSHINLNFITNNYVHALAPSIISYKLWSMLHLQAWKKQINHIDPEHCVGLYYIKELAKSHYNYINNVTVITQFKKITPSLFECDYMKCINSYYTYNNSDREDAVYNDKYIDKDGIKHKFDDKIVFIRISGEFCIKGQGFCLDGCNYGRKFMDNFNLVKSRIQNESQIDFYKKK